MKIQKQYSWAFLIIFYLGISLIGCRPHNNPEHPGQLDPTPIPDTTLYPIARESQIAFLSVYSTPEELMLKGDDDEACAWLWMHEQFPKAAFLSFSSINGFEDLDTIKVLFWLRDVETGNLDDVMTMPEVVQQATPVIQSWYKNGGNIILWGHAVVYIEDLGRLPKGTYVDPKHDLICSCGKGGLEHNHWLMSVQLFPGGKFKKDHATHPLFKDIAIYTNNELRGFGVKGPGWTEDHNLVFFNYPSQITGRSWQSEICYTLLVDYYGITPLAVWDSQTHWVSQLNVYELKQGQTDIQGRALCIGNGGCEFSMKNMDGTNDISSHPKNNCYQDNILTMARNAINYMRQ